MVKHNTVPHLNLGVNVELVNEVKVASRTHTAEKQTASTNNDVQSPNKVLMSGGAYRAMAQYTLTYLHTVGLLR